MASQNVQGDERTSVDLLRNVHQRRFSSNLELKLLFALFDTDNSGTLTREELKLLLQSPNTDGSAVSEDKVAEYLKAADTDGRSPRLHRLITETSIVFRQWRRFPRRIYFFFREERDRRLVRLEQHFPNDR